MVVVAGDAVRVEGLQEFLARVQRLEVEAPRKVIRESLNAVAGLVVADAQRRAPVKTGKLRASIRASSTATYARVSEGSARVPYAGFIDYGGTVGRTRTAPGRKNTARNAARPFIRTGRILYPAFRAQRGNVVVAMNQSLREAARSVGLDVGA